METVKLNNGMQMPVLGLGTYLLKPQDAEQAVFTALTNGYQLIDTANAYMNEKAVGRGIKRSGLKREEVFLESKLWPTVYEKESAIDEMLERLDTEYVDLLLLHQPAGNYLAGYRAMEQAVKDEKVRAIGISNFEGDPLEEILRNCEIKPAIIQVESHPYYLQTELREVLNKHDIKIQAWYPLGHGDKRLIEEEVFTRLAKKYNKTNVQIIMRWHIQIGNIVIPGSKTSDHIRDNINVFDFMLTEQDMADISKINKNKRYYVPSPEITASYAKMDFDFGLDV